MAIREIIELLDGAPDAFRGLRIDVLRTIHRAGYCRDRNLRPFCDVADAHIVLFARPQVIIGGVTVQCTLRQVVSSHILTFLLTVFLSPHYNPGNVFTLWRAIMRGAAL